MAMLEKLIIPPAIVGFATSAGLTIATSNTEAKEIFSNGREIASLMIRCYSPMFIGMVPAMIYAARETYKMLCGGADFEQD